MMNKIYLILGGFLACVAMYFYFMDNYHKNKINALVEQKCKLEEVITKLKNEKEACNDKVAKFNEAQENAANKIEQIRTVVKTVKADCDCYNSRLPDDVVRLLHGK